MRLTHRAQSIGISQLILALVTGAVMIFLMQLMADEMLPGAQNATTNATANQATTWLQTFSTDIVPVVILLLAFMSIIVLAVYRSEIR
jgi:hypothetical protein